MRYFIICLVLTIIVVSVAAIRSDAIMKRLDSANYGSFIKLTQGEKIIKLLGVYIIMCIPIINLIVIGYIIFVPDINYTDMLFNNENFICFKGYHYSLETHNFEKDLID